MYKNKTRKVGIIMIFLANLMAGIGALLSTVSSTACIALLYDEPECPQELLK